MTWFVCLNTKTEKCLNCKSDLNVYKMDSNENIASWAQMFTLRYMFDVNVDKFDSTHIHEQFDSQG